MNIQKQMQELFGNSCYAYCISYMSGKRDIKDLTADVLEGWKKGYISLSGYVSQPHKFYNFCFGKDLCKDVRKPDYKESETEQIVCWEYGKSTHFVCMQSGKITFDPWPDSNTVKNGKPTTIREFVLS